MLYIDLKKKTFSHAIVAWYKTHLDKQVVLAVRTFKFWGCTIQFKYVNCFTLYG